jgi:amino acid adenylation domain-containing protein
MPEQVLLSDAKRQLLEKLRRGEISRPARQESIEPNKRDVLVPLAPSQRQIWLHSQMAPGVPVYNEPITIRRRGPLNCQLLERTLQEILRRHEILRSVFANVDGQVVQVVRDVVELPIPFSDLSALPEQERQAAAVRLATKYAQLPFDLYAGPLLRPSLVKLGDEDYFFNLTFHHLIFDGLTAYQVLLPELDTIYDAFSHGGFSPLPEPALQYADYALWQNRQLEENSTVAQLAYWRKVLEGAEEASLDLPTSRPHPAMRNFRGGTETFSIAPGVLDSVKRAARENGVTLYMYLLACFHALLYRYSGQEDVMVGGVVDGRRRAEFESVMGCFTNTLVLRSRPRAVMTFRDFLAQVKEMVLGAVANGDIPFDLVVRELHPKRDPGRNPYYQVMFSLGPQPVQVADSGWELEQLGIDTGASKSDLYFALDDCVSGMVGRLHYSYDLFDPLAIRRMVGHWLTLLESTLVDPSSRLGDLALLTEAEKSQLLQQGRGPAREIPRLTIHELIEKQAALTPDAVAVEAAGTRRTYLQMNEQANRLARRLQSAGVTSETLVAVCVERTMDLVVAPLAVLKAGGAYVPLDVAFPSERLKFLIEDAQAPILLISRRLEDQLPRTAAKIIYCEDIEGEAANLPLAATPESLAYVRYTSGSTGRPKGVLITHGALVNLLLSMQQEPGFTDKDSLLAITTHSFDISELEICLPLISGGRLIIADRQDASDPRRLTQRLRESKCTVMQATPATWRGLSDAGWSGQANLKALCGGEALSRDLAEMLLPRVGQLWNVYGPTETTVWSSLQRITSGTGAVPIGHPILNTQMYILDAQLNLVPSGASGELCIGGAGVAVGYLRREELTERFVANPFRAGQRIYRTGDLARWLPGGAIECQGRADNQVKIRGFRIELDEIETILSGHPGVGPCAVVAREDGPGDKQLVVYFESPARPLPEAGELRAHLQQFLPDYMVPATFVHLGKLPLTPNNKIDRKALAVRGDLRTEVHSGFVAPRDALELTLATAWAKVLRLKQVGIHDDFFESGGHSLAAVRLLVEIEKATGRTLPLATLFQASTVDALANLLRKNGWAPTWTSLVPIQPLGSKTPLFLIHGAEGNVLLYRQMIKYLGPEQPVYGLQSRGLNGDGNFHTSIEEIAAQYVKDITSVQPAGPYRLGGYCLGGTIAFEVAQQLTTAGQNVEIVIMMETYNASLIPSAKLLLQAPLRLLQNLWFHLANTLLLHGPGRREFLREKLDVEVARARVRFDAAYHGAWWRKKSDHSYPHLILKKLNDKAAGEYKPKPYAGRVALIRSKGAFVGLGSPTLEWDQSATALEVHELPIYPRGMLVEPFCRSLAETVLACLQKHDHDPPD